MFHNKGVNGEVVLRHTVYVDVNQDLIYSEMGHVTRLQKYFKLMLNVGVGHIPDKNCFGGGIKYIATTIK